MVKAYVVFYSPSVKVRHGTDVVFALQSRACMTWDSEARAENACVGFRSISVHLAVVPSGSYICEDFRVERRADGRLVVFCEVPFDRLAYSTRVGS